MAMNPAANALLIQIACYAGLMIFTIFGIAFFMRGFFWKYFKVKTSMGKNVMIKVRTPLRDYYTVGWVEENFLCYKLKDITIRMAIKSDSKVFYRSLGITWVDVDEEKNAICSINYEPTPGFDAKKHSDLLTRAMMRPTITSSQEKIILVCVLLGLILTIGTVYFAYKASTISASIMNNLPGMLQKAMDAVTTKGITGGAVTGIGTINTTTLLS